MLKVYNTNPVDPSYLPVASKAGDVLPGLGEFKSHSLSSSRIESGVSRVAAHKPAVSHAPTFKL
jgi:hypothetical protein